MTRATEIWYDPDPRSTLLDEDRDWVEGYFDLNEGDVDAGRMSPWLLRIEMARDMMVDKKLLLSEVAERINRCRAALRSGEGLGGGGVGVWGLAAWGWRRRRPERRGEGQRWSMPPSGSAVLLRHPVGGSVVASLSTVSTLSPCPSLPSPRSDFEDELHCLFNDDNADKLILRIR